MKKAPSKSTTYAHLTEEEAQRSADFARDLVPAPRYADEYVHRSINGFHDFDVLDTARDLGVNVLLYGPTGSAKSHFFKAYGATHGLPVATVSCHGAADPALWFGSYRPLPSEDGTGTRWVWCDGVITTVLRHGGVIFLDEINFLTGSIAASLHQVLRERELILLEKGNEVVHAAPDVLIVAAYNPGYAGTNELNEAFANRFALKLEWDYDPEVEASLLGEKSELLPLAEALRESCRERALETPCPTNALLEFADIAASFDTEFAIANFRARYRDDEQLVVDEHIDLLKIAAVDFTGEDDEAEADADAESVEG